MNRRLGYLAAAAFVATVWLANWAIGEWGVVSVGFGLAAPAGVYFAGLAFGLRDLTHQALGRRWVIACVIAGAALSAIVADVWRIALASAVAFLVSEALDLAVYERVRRRGFLPAVMSSNVVGLFVDSVIFLSIAFGSLAFLWGQVVGKTWVTLATVALIAVFQVARRRIVFA